MLRGHNWQHFAHRPQCYVTSNSTSLSLKPEKIFNPSKKIIWAYSFVKKRRRVMALFISIFLKKRSLSNARWFLAEKRKIEKGNLYLTKNWFGKNESCCAKDNHNYMSSMYEKEFSNSNFNLAVIAKYRFFKKLPQISQVHKSYYFLSKIEIF